eukprot:2336115-Karenia_brevis.AAC.1
MLPGEACNKSALAASMYSVPGSSFFFAVRHQKKIFEFFACPSGFFNTPCGPGLSCLVAPHDGGKD